MTVLRLPGKTFEDGLAGRNTGVVLMWTPGSKEFRMLAGTELPGNNGIETSPDDREFYVASTQLKRIVVFSRANPSKPLRSAQLKEFFPDNVRLVGDRLITAGMIADAIDPKTMVVTEIDRGPAVPPYTGTATAMPTGDNLWLSSFTADRVAYRALKR